MKESSGITLIVLIVTIVVLLILAGVTVAHITGGEGIIEQAQEKRDKTKTASEEAILGNVAIEATDKYGEITEANLRTALSKYNVEITPSGGLYRIVFKDSNNLYKMNHQGEFFYREDIAPTEMWGKIENNVLYLRSTQQDGYSIGTKWNNADITKVIIEEPIAPSTCEELFSSCIALEEIENIENLHTENVTSMKQMFHNCKKIKKLNLKYFDTTNVTTMYMQFSECNSLINLNISSFNTNSVTNMGFMFLGCNTIKEIDLSNFNTSNVEVIYHMFNRCYNLEKIDLCSFNTKKITNLGAMFLSCRNLKQIDLSSFDTSNVTDTSSMFQQCNNLTTIYVSNKFDLQNVTNSRNMFNACSKLVGGKGTKCSNAYTSSYTDATYARIDGGPNSSTPGYFTLKEN